MSNHDLNRENLKNAPKKVRDDLNIDPISGEPGAHPVGTGVGAAGGAAAGAAVGSVAGPVGAAVGGVVGAVAGGLVGKNVGEAVNPTAEDTYWRENFVNQPYFNATRAQYSDLNYDRDYDHAYRLGYEQRHAYDEHTRFEDAEADLKLKWEQMKGESHLTWEQAKYAVRDAWNRVTR